MMFSPDGAAIYLGTNNGKLLILDLRALDKPPKTVVVSESGSRVETISVQVGISSSYCVSLLTSCSDRKKSKW